MKKLFNEQPASMPAQMHGALRGFKVDKVDDDVVLTMALELPPEMILSEEALYELTNVTDLCEDKTPKDIPATDLSWSFQGPYRPSERYWDLDEVFTLKIEPAQGELFKRGQNHFEVSMDLLNLAPRLKCKFDKKMGVERCSLIVHPVLLNPTAEQIALLFRPKALTIVTIYCETGDVVAQPEAIAKSNSQTEWPPDTNAQRETDDSGAGLPGAAQLLKRAQAIGLADRPYHEDFEEAILQYENRAHKGAFQKGYQAAILNPSSACKPPYSGDSPSSKKHADIYTAGWKLGKGRCSVYSAKDPGAFKPPKKAKLRPSNPEYRKEAQA